MKQPANGEANRILHRLGFAAPDISNYRWCWAADLTWDVAVNGDGIVWIPGKRTERVQIARDLRSQWVMGVWLDLGTEKEWIETIGHGPEWPGRGIYFPVSQPGGWVALRPGVEPSALNSEEFVKIRRRLMAQTVADSEDALRKAEGDQRADVADKVKGMLDFAIPVRAWNPKRPGAYGVWQRKPSAEKFLIEVA